MVRLPLFEARSLVKEEFMLVERIRENSLLPLPIIAMFVVSIAVGLVAVLRPTQVLPVSLVGLIILAAWTHDKLYDLLLYATVLIFLLAQFQMTAFDLGRWVFLLLLALVSLYVRQRFTLNPIVLGIYLVGVYAMATSAQSYYPTVSFFKAISLLLFAAFLLLVPSALESLHPSTGAPSYMLRMYLHLAIVIVLSNAFFYLLSPGASLLAGRFRGWFVNPNGIGAVYGIFFMPILVSEATKRRWGRAKVGLLCVALLATLELLATQSRAGIGAGAASLLVLALGQKKVSARIVTVASLGFVVVAIYLANPSSNILQRFVFRDEVTFRGSGRLPVWSETWNRFAARPILGSGLGVGNTGGSAQDLAFNSYGLTIEKGNSFLGALEELGLLGVTLLTVMLLVPVLKRSWRGFYPAVLPADHSSLVYSAVVVAGLLNAFFEAWLLSVGSFPCFSFWIFAAMLFHKDSGAQPG